MRIEYDTTTGVIRSTDSGRTDVGTAAQGCTAVVLDVAAVNPFTQRINPATQQLIPYAPTYKVLRRAEYPPLEDLADAIYWREHGNDAPMIAYLAACDAVKAKYPKP